MIRFGVSGSTILSDPDRVDELFWDGIDHVEVGALSSPAALDNVLARARQGSISVGFHSPLFRGGSKYDLLMHVEGTPELAWQQLEEELSIAQKNQSEYLLVHFPYFSLASEQDPIPQIEAGLSRLRALQDRFETKVLCEPKLGLRRDLGGIGILQAYPVSKWCDFGLSMCWDMGDYLLASNTLEECRSELHRWSEVIDVIHVHNVKVTAEQHYWIAIHPSHESGEEYFTVKPLLLDAAAMDILLVWEHTPHFTPDHSFALAGFQWAKEVLGSTPNRGG